MIGKASLCMRNRAWRSISYWRFKYSCSIFLFSASLLVRSASRLSLLHTEHHLVVWAWREQRSRLHRCPRSHSSSTDMGELLERGKSTLPPLLLAISINRLTFLSHLTHHFEAPITASKPWPAAHSNLNWTVFRSSSWDASWGASKIFAADWVSPRHFPEKCLALSLAEAMRLQIVSFLA